MITIDALIAWEQKYSEYVVDDGPYVFNQEDEQLMIQIIKSKLAVENITLDPFNDIFELHCVIPDNSLEDVLRIIMEAFVDMLNINKVDPNLFN